jgi:hypothetical protein
MAGMRVYRSSVGDLAAHLMEKIMKSTVLKIAASAIAISVGTSAFAQMDQQGLITLTCSSFMKQDATEMRTVGLQLKGFPGTNIDPTAEVTDTTSTDTKVPSMAPTVAGEGNIGTVVAI